MRELGEIWNLYTQAGARPGRPHLHLSARPFTVSEKEHERFRGSLVLGLIIHGADGREYDLGVDLLWDENAWTIETSLWVANEAGGQDLLRQLPDRMASDLSVCLSQLQEAVADLASFRDIVCAK
jgi:hypothetical protein